MNTPGVTESMVESLARVPDGYSLIVGGFYGEAKSGGRTKIPLLGDIPILNFFFKSKEATQRADQPGLRRHPQILRSHQRLRQQPGQRPTPRRHRPRLTRLGG